MALTRIKKEYRPPRLKTEVVWQPLVQLTCLSVGLGGCGPGLQRCPDDSCVACADECPEV